MDDQKIAVEYLSNYEYTCDECKQTIKPRTPYLLKKRYTSFQGQPITEFGRVHVKCPEHRGEV